MYNEGSEIMEGFICPICKSDEKKLERLLQHFDEKHSEEKDLIQTFRDVFKIAKKKILNLDENEYNDNASKSNKQGLASNPFIEDFEFLDENQEIGVLQSYYEYFKAIRNPRLERYATETNKLIIRLNKLLTNRPTEPQQIKQHEQNVSFSFQFFYQTLSLILKFHSSSFHGLMEN
jgi:rabenosyn-5